LEESEDDKSRDEETRPRRRSMAKDSNSSSLTSSVGAER